ncbi:MAG TPA: hypothetical protein VMK13_16305 [Streptosporangiaceae bacterium]|nr:hypothetical protein [Streptosporangiaceae bacterium]
MSCEHLICAQCAGPVAEGRCATCRAARTHVHHSGPGLSVPLVLAALFVLLLLALTATHLAR